MGKFQISLLIFYLKKKFPKNYLQVIDLWEKTLRNFQIGEKNEMTTCDRKKKRKSPTGYSNVNSKCCPQFAVSIFVVQRLFMDHLHTICLFHFCADLISLENLFFEF